MQALQGSREWLRPMRLKPPTKGSAAQCTSYLAPSAASLAGCISPKLNAMLLLDLTPSTDHWWNHSIFDWSIHVKLWHWALFVFLMGTARTYYALHKDYNERNDRWSQTTSNRRKRRLS